MIVKFLSMHPNAMLPRYQTPGAAGFDLHAIEPGEVPAYGRYRVRTGLAVELQPGYALFIYSRSGHGAKHGVNLANCVGLVDSDYRGEIIVVLQNNTGIEFDYPAGARIAQAVVQPIERVEIVWAESLSETERDAGGFGSTG